MTSLLLDLRHAARVLVKNSSATAIAVFTLALAIGATTAIFSVVYGVLLRPLPYPAPDRLMAVWEVNHRGTYSRLADPNFDDFRDRNHSFSAMAKFTDWFTSVAGTAEPARATVATVSRDFFTVLSSSPRSDAASPRRMRDLAQRRCAVVSHRYWAQSLRSPSSLSSLHLRIEDRIYTVVGVMPAGFQFPANADVWVPAELNPENTSRTSHNYQGIGRLRDGVSAAQAAADISGLAKDVIRTSPEHGDYLLADATALPLQIVDHAARRLDPLCAAWRGVLPSSDCMRQRHESSPRASGGAATRARHPSRARRRTRPADPSIRDGGDPAADDQLPQAGC